MRDRTGEEIEDDEPLPDHHPACDGRGLWEDHNGMPVYCVACRPHLATHKRRRRAGLDTERMVNA